MRIDFIRRAVSDVDAAAIRFPSGNARSVALVGIRDASVVLFLELVFYGVRSRVAAQPELFDELLALLVGVQPVEGRSFLIGDDVNDVFVQPLLVRRLEL